MQYLRHYSAMLMSDLICQITDDHNNSNKLQNTKIVSHSLTFAAPYYVALVVYEEVRRGIEQNDADKRARRKSQTHSSQ